jgi:hypothetical protein
MLAAVCSLVFGGAAKAVETAFTSPNILTVGGAGGFAGADDAISSEVPIGFTFTFGGVNYTTAVMSHEWRALLCRRKRSIFQ